VFEDGGTAFIDALETRETPMPSLLFEGSLPLNDENLERLLQSDSLEKLKLPSLGNEFTFLPFAARRLFNAIFPRRRFWETLSSLWILRPKSSLSF
jgi:hypothetical protein